MKHEVKIHGTTFTIAKEGGNRYSITDKTGKVIYRLAPEKIFIINHDIIDHYDVCIADVPRDNNSLDRLINNGFKILCIWTTNKLMPRIVRDMSKNGYRVVDQLDYVRLTKTGKLARSLGFYFQHSKDTLVVSMRSNLDYDDVFDSNPNETTANVIIRKREPKYYLLKPP